MISVIVPVYNVEKYLETCISSILGQTYGDFELILVDDGSRDNSGVICDAWAKKDGRIKVLHQENQGLSGARNTGLSASAGEYIAYIDSDDSVEDTYLEELYNNALRCGADVSVCGYRPVWEETGQKEKNRKEKDINEDFHVRTLTGKEAAWTIVAENDRKMITAWGKIYHRRLKPLLEYPERKIHEDEFVTYRVLYDAGRVAVSDRPLYRYLQRGSSIMNRGYSQRRLDKIQALEEAVEFFQDRKDDKFRLYAQKRYLLQLAIAWYRVSVYMPERKDLLDSLRAKWMVSYRECWKDIAGIAGMIDKTAVKVYRISPGAYRIMAGIYERAFPEV